MSTNEPRSFQRVCVLDTGLSEFNLMTLTFMRKKPYDVLTYNHIHNILRLLTS